VPPHIVLLVEYLEIIVIKPNKTKSKIHFL